MFINEFNKEVLKVRCRELGIVVEGDSKWDYFTALRRFYDSHKGYQQRWGDGLIDSMQSFMLPYSSRGVGVKALVEAFNSNEWVLQVYDIGDRVWFIRDCVGNYRVLSRYIDGSTYRHKDITNNIVFPEKFIKSKESSFTPFIADVILTVNGGYIATDERYFGDVSAVGGYINNDSELSKARQARCPLVWNILDVVYYGKDVRDEVLKCRWGYINEVYERMSDIGFSMVDRHNTTITNKRVWYEQCSSSGKSVFLRNLNASYCSSMSRSKDFIRVNAGEVIPRDVEVDYIEAYVGDIVHSKDGKPISVSLFRLDSSVYIGDSKSIVKKVKGIKLGDKLRVKKRGSRITIDI